MDCAHWVANATKPEWMDEAQVLHWEARMVALAGDGDWTLGRFHGPELCGQQHCDDFDDVTACEAQEFSKDPCDVCGSTLFGARHAVTFWPGRID
jgi:hypothetical protein